MLKRLWVGGLISISILLLTACDNYPYKKDIQEIYDWNNQSGNKAICMIVADIPLASYPYTIKYMEGEDLPFSAGQRIPFYNRLGNETLHYFAELGFFTEEKVGEDAGRPLYRYDLTDLGRQYADKYRNKTNFCFGRIVVDSIDRTKDSINGVGGGKLRDVHMTYHVENIPDWVKNSNVCELFRYSVKMATGEPLKGIHTYRVLGNDKLQSMGGAVNGRYRWATRSDSRD